MVILHFLHAEKPHRRREGLDAFQGRVYREDGSAALGVGTRTRLAEVEGGARPDAGIVSIPTATLPCRMVGESSSGFEELRPAAQRRSAGYHVRRHPLSPVCV